MRISAVVHSRAHSHSWLATCAITGVTVSPRPAAARIPSSRRSIVPTIGSKHMLAATITSPQSCVAEYIGKHGASVPSVRMISEF